MTMLRSIISILFIIFTLLDSKKNTIEGLKQSYCNEHGKRQEYYGRDVINSNMINNTEETFEFELQHCKCHRKLKKVSKISNLNETTCSIDAYHRGEGQKIVGFSYYREKIANKSFQKYVNDIKENLQLMKKYYPGYIMRIYHNFERHHPMHKYLCKFACNNPILDLCDVKNLTGSHILKNAAKVFPIKKLFPESWSYFATLDSQVDIFISRDLDNRFNDREVAAVNDWLLNSQKPFHIIKEPTEHEGVPIVPGLWGTRLLDASIRNKWIESWKNGLENPALMFSSHENLDTNKKFLEKYVWPWAQDVYIGHNSSRTYIVDKSDKLNRDRVILFWNTFYDDGWFNIGRKYEPFQTCFHKNCFTTRNRSLLTNPNFIVDAVVFFGVQCPQDDLRKIKQIKESEEIIHQNNHGIKPKIVLFMTESPQFWKGMDNLSGPNYQGIFDITMTYRHDSEVHLAYGNLINRTTHEKIQPNSFIDYYDENQFVNLTEIGLTELAKRPKDIAWLVSHCDTMSKRENYVEEMQKYKGLKIDVFGKCGNNTSEIPERNANRWATLTAYTKLASSYKFYLSFENSRCYDYITEKIFLALKVGMIPVVLGGLTKHDYKKIAPPHSFLHVDDFSSPEDLMKRMHAIANDPQIYNSYFWWRLHYGVVVNDPCCSNQSYIDPGCQLCNVLNANEIIQKNDYTNFTTFWNKCRN